MIDNVEIFLEKQSERSGLGGEWREKGSIAICITRPQACNEALQHRDQQNSVDPEGAPHEPLVFLHNP